ncbi:MAG: hypothetical protein JSR59_04445 [Proteobacteria bacterium]|nr:hypothetical protein [Pseudomonadota bacterium]
MRTVPLVVAALALAAPALASAYCFSIYDNQNRLTYQSQTPPIDLSMPISQGMAQRFPGQHLVMGNDASQCVEVDGTSPDISRLSTSLQPSADALVRVLQRIPGRSGDSAASDGDYVGASPVPRAPGTRVPARTLPATRR